MQREWVRAKEHYICFPDTKTGGQVRIIGQAAIDLLEATADPRGVAVSVSG